MGETFTLLQLPQLSQKYNKIVTFYFNIDFIQEWECIKLIESESKNNVTKDLYFKIILIFWTFY